MVRIRQEAQDIIECGSESLLLDDERDEGLEACPRQAQERRKPIRQEAQEIIEGDSESLLSDGERDEGLEACPRQAQERQKPRWSLKTLGGYQSGQMGQTVNLLAYAYGGSNPSLPTIFKTAEMLWNYGI